ncbi:MAG: nuclear transport factor 2 family protein [Novosphingobium sp.]
MKAGEAALAQRLDRLDRVESRLAIAELIHTYARCIRYDRPEQVGALFTEDGCFELRKGHPDKSEFEVNYRHEGRAAIHAQMSHNKGTAHPVPLIHNLILDVEGDAATSTCVMNGTIYGTAHVIMGEYHDTFRRIDGKWLFAERVFTMFASASSN